MKLQVNTIYNEDCLIGMKKLADKSVSLIIADFPYFEVKGKFDFVWKDFAEFLAWVELCAKQFKRVLADNGTLLVYGHAKKIAYKQVIFDKYFNLENNLVWQKNDCQTLRTDFTESRVFAPVTERILMYSNEVQIKSLEVIYSNPDCFKSIKTYMREERAKLMAAKGFTTLAQFNRFIDEWTNTKSVVSRHYFADSQWIFPTEKIYKRLQETGFWKRKYESSEQEYKGLRQEYESLRRPFNNAINKYSDVLKFSQEAHITKNYKHPTQKPPTLSKVLIETCTNETDLVLVPFVGSGVECVAAKESKRNYIGFELDKEYCTMAQERVKNSKIIADIPKITEVKTTKNTSIAKPKQVLQTKQVAKFPSVLW